MTADAATPSLWRSLPPVYAAAALRLLLPLAVLPLMASRLGAEAFGRLSYILVWSGLLAMVVEGGFLAAATRLAVGADAPQRWQIAQQVFSARCLLCVPTVGLSLLAARWAAQPVADFGAIAVLACALGWPATWYLQATQQLNRWARVELPVYGALLLALWALAHSVEAYVVLQGVASAVLAVAGWAWLRGDLARQAADGSLWSRPQLGAGLRLGWTMLPVSIAGAAYSFALPAAASSQLPKAELGLYFMADRIVRAALAAADPMFSVVYPRIVQRFRLGARAALRYAAAWAGAGLVAGSAILAVAALVWPLLVDGLAPRLGGLDALRLHAVLQVLGWLLPLLLGWKFLGYWMLGSGRFDVAYRTCMIAGAVLGVAGAATIGGAAGAIGLAWTALLVELAVIAIAVGGVALTRR